MIDVKRDIYGTLTITDTDGKENKVFRNSDTRLVIECVVRFHHALMQIEKLCGDTTAIEKLVQIALKRSR